MCWQKLAKAKKFYLSPGSPAADANCLQDVNAKLTDINKEEDEEAERTVAPVMGTEKKVVRPEQRQENSSVSYPCGSQLT